MCVQQDKEQRKLNCWGYKIENNQKKSSFICKECAKMFKEIRDLYKHFHSKQCN